MYDYSLVCIHRVGMWKLDDNWGIWFSPSIMYILFSGLNSRHQASGWLSHLSDPCSLSFLIDAVNFSEPQVFFGLLWFHFPNTTPPMFTGKNPYITEDRLIHLILLPVPPACWGYRHAPPWPIYGQIKTKHSTKIMPSLAPSSFLLFLE